MNAGSKKLNEMNRLADMGHFPAAVNAGATLNVLVTLAVTWWIEPRLPVSWAPVAWVAVVLAVNLLPVVVLRLALSPASTYPSLNAMNFWRDQHKFSDWVYVAASANMAFWVLTGWAVFAIWHTPAALGAMMAVAFLVTFSPVLLRSSGRRQA
ncbi:MAG TPA: hypothetical protein VKV02_05880 [Acidobacteriaceae bacterium]|nr:hypothetical protein [Acidobacteriaceae bacterium]